MFVLTWLFYTQYVLPKRTYEYYSTLIPSLGYKLYKYPFKPAGIPVL